MGSGDMRNSTFARNLYWSPSNPKTCCKWPCPAPASKQNCDETWAQWRAAGQDTGSVENVDPQFVDLDTHNYRLQPGSAAAKIGWEAIDYDLVGPRTAR